MLRGDSLKRKFMACATMLIAVLLVACSSSDDSALTVATAAPKTDEVSSSSSSKTIKPIGIETKIASDPFAGRDDIAVAELFAAMSAQADGFAASPVLRREYEALLAKHRLRGDDALYADFLRIRLAFEATRAGGWWGLEWRITDREPHSEAIWSQWRSLQIADTATLPPTTAIAECDELSALFAVVARGLGLSRRSQVGLLWPTSNHTVAVWVIDDAKGVERARIVVPTSQIFLDSAQSLDTDRFDPWRQPKVYDYGRKDIAANATLPAPLARYFIAQTERYGALSRGELQGKRNRRAYEQRQGLAVSSAQALSR